ncbi:hypothetical protein ACFP77_22740, partial [Shinella zoogloeoides]
QSKSSDRQPEAYSVNHGSRGLFVALTFNAANTEIAIRKLLFLARNNADEQAKRRLMPIVRDLIQTVVIGKTPGHQPASLQVHGDIANIMASMDVIDIMQQQFVAAAQNDLMARIASGEIDTEHKKKKLLEAYAEELLRKYPEWENLQVSVVAGAGFHLCPNFPRSVPVFRLHEVENAEQLAA